MNKTLNHIQADINNDFALADLLSDLIKQSVQNVAEEVVSRYPRDQQYLADTKVGAYDAWVNRLCSMLREADRDYLLQLLQNQLDKPSSRS